MYVFFLYCINVDRPACNYDSLYKSRSHNYIQPATQSHAAVAHTYGRAHAAVPVQHLFSHSLAPEPAHPFNYSRHL